MKALLNNREARLTFLATLLFFVAFYTLIVPLPRYLTSVGLPDWQVGLVLGSFGLASLIGRPAAGLASDWVGRRGVVVAGTLAFVVGVLGVERTTHPWLLLSLRILQALGYVAVTTATTARITDVVPAAQRASALAWFGIAANIAMTLTPAGVGMLLPWMRLSGAFWLAAGLAVLCLLLSLFFQGTGSDGSDRSKQSKIQNPKSKIWSLPAPLLWPWITTLLLGVGFGAWFQYLPILTERRAIEPAGLLYTMYGLSIIATRLITAPWLGRQYDRLLLMLSFCMMTAGLLIFALTESIAWYIPATILMAASGGILHPLLMALHVQLMPDAMRGRAIATFYLGFDGGNGLGTWLLGFVLQEWGLTALYAAAAIATLLGIGVSARGADWGKRGFVSKS